MISPQEPHKRAYIYIYLHIHIFIYRVMNAVANTKSARQKCTNFRKIYCFILTTQPLVALTSFGLNGKQSSNNIRNIRAVFVVDILKHIWHTCALYVANNNNNLPHKLMPLTTYLPLSHILYFLLNLCNCALACQPKWIVTRK